MGYTSLDEYYYKASFWYKLNNMKIPTFFLNATDDFFGNSGKDVEVDNENVIVATSISGGHATYMSGAIIPYLWYN